MKYRLEKLMYTLKHKKAFLKVEKQLTGKISLSGVMHDMDKVIMMILLPIDMKKIQMIHRMNSKHHLNKIEKSEKDYIQMIIDWECASLTKPDKPLNAYDTLYNYFPQLEAQILPLLKRFGIAETTK